MHSTLYSTVGFTIVLVAVSTLLITYGHAFGSVGGTGNRHSSSLSAHRSQLQQSMMTTDENPSETALSRKHFLSVVAGGIMSGSMISLSSSTSRPFVGGPEPVWAAQNISEACLSKCLYECTKPKGAEQKSRAECLPECKKQCKESSSATTTSS